MSKEDVIYWHSAFFQAIKAEFKDFREVLDFRDEVSLTMAPLKIDVLIIKKKKSALIHKNIGAIFRAVNIFEYKSPTDSLSIESFNRVCAYTYLYLISNKEVFIQDLTVSLVQTAKPLELIKHLTQTMGFTIEKPQPGIYRVHGATWPMQLIASQELSEDENLWLKNLTDQLAAENLSTLSRVIARAKDLQLDAYVNAIMRANVQSLKEVLAMGALTLEDVFMEFGYEELTQKWLKQGRQEGWQEGRQRGRQEGQLEVARKLLSKGFDAETVADSTGISLEALRKLSRNKDKL